MTSSHDVGKIYFIVKASEKLGKSPIDCLPLKLSTKWKWPSVFNRIVLNNAPNYLGLHEKEQQ